MDRRDALRLLGATVLTPLLNPLSAEERWNLGIDLHRRIATGARAGQALSAEQMAEVRALADTIIPRTDTPSAVDVGAPEFVDVLLSEWYSDDDKAALLRGLDALTERCRTAKAKPIAELDADARTAFALSIDGQRGDLSSPEGAYARIKENLVFGFLTSEPIGKMTSTMPIRPGRFDGCIPVRAT
jgi:gluconate 2-dehydrogenase gamma chain